MTTALAIVLLLLCAAITMFAVNKPRMDAVALMMLIALPFTGVLTMDALADGVLSWPEAKVIVEVAGEKLEPEE